MMWSPLLFAFATASAGGTADLPPGSGIASALEAIAAGLSVLVGQLAKVVIDSFQEPLLWLASVFGACVILASLAQLLRESDFDPRALVSWLLRTTLGFVVFAHTALLFQMLEGSKHEIAELTAPVMAASRQRFHDSFNEFVEQRFLHSTSAVPAGENITPLWDSSVPWHANVSRILHPTAWSPARLFTVLTIGRALLMFTEITMRVLWASIRLALLLAAPFMIAAGVDRQLAHRLSYPYLWGVAVCYLIWPPVADVIATIAYTAGTSTTQIFLKATQGGGHTGELGYAVCATSLVLLTGALLQLGAPLIAYRLSRGQVLEAVAGATFQGLGALAGTAIELCGLRASAGMEWLARTAEVEGGYQSALTTAGSSREASLLQARAATTSAQELARAAKIVQTHSNQAGLHQSLDHNQAARDAQVALAVNSTTLARGEIETARTSSLEERDARLERDLKELQIERDSAQRQVVVRAVAGVASSGVQVLEEIGQVIAAVAGGGAGAAGAAAGAEAGAAERVATGTSGASVAGPTASSSSVSSTPLAPSPVLGNGSSALSPASSLDPPGASSPHGLGEQPLGGRGGVADLPSTGQEERSALDGAASGGQPLITLGLGAFHLYNTGRVAREHGENLTAYAGEMTHIANRRAHQLTVLQEGALTTGVGIYQERNERLNRAVSDAALTRQSGINQAAAIQQETAQEVYHQETEVASIRYHGAVRAASIGLEASTRAADLRQEATIIRQSSQDLDRKVKDALQLRF